MVGPVPILNKGGGAIALPLYFMKGLKLWLNM
jgi:hypothetical protein